MPERYKKTLQRPGQETQSITERPSEFYQLELPDFRIPTVINSEDSIMTGLENRKTRDILEHKGRASGISNTDSFLQEGHPSLLLLPFAPEIMGSGLGLGILKTLGGYAGSYIGSKVGNEVGYTLDKTFNKQLFEPLGEIVGSFAGFGKGYNLAGKAGMQGALNYISRTGKNVPNWFMRPELRMNVGRVNQRTLFAEDQTPKYNSNQLSGLNRKVYQSPFTSQFEMVPKAAFASDFSGVENLDPGNFGYGGTKPNFGLRKLWTERRSRQLLNSIAEEEKRNAVALRQYGKNWKDLTYTQQYWLDVNHGNKWDSKQIIPRRTISESIKLDQE